MSSFADALETPGLRADLERRGIPVYDVQLPDGFIIKLLTWRTACHFATDCNAIILPRKVVHGA